MGVTETQPAMSPRTRALLSDVLIFLKEKHNSEVLCEISRFKN